MVHDNVDELIATMNNLSDWSAIATVQEVEKF